MTRRDFFTLGIGAAAAVPLTPIPWKLLDDTAKWSQNWSWIPRPPTGERTIRYTSCTLCPAGCGIEARCVGRNVIGIAPVAAHPVSKGILCPYAFGAHQLPYHPARITEPLHHGMPLLIDKAVAQIASRINTGAFAILDERPGRAVSAAFHKLATARRGSYLVADRCEAATLQQIADDAGLNAADLGLSLENVRTLISFGAPVLESWATPGRVLTLWKQKRLDIVQIEPGLSKTAALATQWFRRTDENTIRSLRDRGPILAVSAGGLPVANERSIAILNQGSGAIVRRGGEPAIRATRLAAIPDNSLDVLLVDHGPLGGSLAFDALRAKLRHDGILVSLSPYRAGVSALADYVIPTPAFLESLDEGPTPWDAAVPSYALSPALLDPPPHAMHPLDLLARVLDGDAAPEAIMRAKVATLYAARRGHVFTFADRATKPIVEFKSTDELWKAFRSGACWIDPDARPVPVSGSAQLTAPAESPAIPAGKPAVKPPLFTKLDQESRIGRV